MKRPFVKRRSGCSNGTQFATVSRTTLRAFPPPPPSVREYMPGRSADRHRPEAHSRRASILSPAVTATGTTFWPAWTSGTSKSDASLQHDLISAPVHFESSGRACCASSPWCRV